MGRRGCVTRSLLVLAASGVLLLLLLLLGLLSPPSSLYSESASVSSFLRVPLRALNDFPTQQQQQQQQQLIPEKSKSPCTTVGASRWVEGLPTLYVVTPTYPRAEQIPEITRTAQTLLNVPNVVWIVSEDADTPTPALTRYLNESALSSVYMRVQMPAQYQKVKNKPRGVANRMAGMNWVRENAKEGVLYFADDDNTYDIRLFEQMRWTERVSMFPVGLVTKLGVSTPIVREGRVVGFYDGWIAKRKFPVDMAGFAVNVAFLLQHPEASMPFKVGYEEDGFLLSLGIAAADIEPLAFNCTKIWVWHTQTKKNDPATSVTQNNATIGTNLDVIKDLLWKKPPGSRKEEEKKGKK
ncbi:galactosylgalactosylxylosylprotein 3-beta-glucuronosyltransferase P-like [Eriocheir sinensis]|uniref:galactosylgalactosylxylosylprotein 3-beta-glucuronosyltransferase P-like n=1 Tax=Eriocheir sinensis TaxID=95602 RepID=UPI0021C7ABD9|nr:galactosylgalactosylxylosylprotein 3-beta-glucuronosyltransferase P-like [Eriocheir sinensis]